MPEEFQGFGESWRRFHPDWDFRLWTDANRPNLHNEDAYVSARSFADKANILRYEILLAQGGVYIDTDFECQRSIEHLIARERCFAARQWDGVINNAIIGAIPEHSAIKALVSGLTDHIAANSSDIPSVFRSGPFYFGPIVRRFRSVRIFPPELFYPYNWHERWKRHVHFDQAYAVHHWTLSGRSADQPKRSVVGSADSSCAHVVVIFDETCDKQRLIWTLEGLCLQTVSNFDVSIVLTEDAAELPATLMTDYDGRLRLTRNPLRGSQTTFLEIFTESGAPITVLLQGNCVPDPQFLRDAVLEQGLTASVAIPRFYPASKFYEFKSGWPLDYDGLKFHSLKPDTGSEVNSFRDDYVAERYFGIAVHNAWIGQRLGADVEAPLCMSLYRIITLLSEREDISILSLRPELTCLCAARTQSSRDMQEGPNHGRSHAMSSNFGRVDDTYTVRPRTGPI